MMPVCKPVPDMLMGLIEFWNHSLELAAKINHFSQVEYGSNILKINF